jgi:hypothetical protein
MADLQRLGIIIEGGARHKRLTLRFLQRRIRVRNSWKGSDRHYPTEELAAG